MIPHNNIISEYKNKNSDSKVMTLEKSDVANFFKQKKLILDQVPDTIITDCLPHEKIVCFDKMFSKLIIEKGIFIKNCALEKGKILSFIRLNDKSRSLIEKVTEIQIDYKETLSEKEIISHEFLLFDLSTISKIKTFHELISVKTKIILISKVLPDYLENIIYPHQLIHVQNEELNLRLFVKVITNEFSITNPNRNFSDDKIYSNFSTDDDLFNEIKISDICRKDSMWDEKQNQEFRKYRILKLLENQNTDSIPELCDIIFSEENHTPIKILLSSPEIKNKMLLYRLFKNYYFCKYFLRYNKIASIDEERLKDSINLITGNKIKDNLTSNFYDFRNLNRNLSNLLTENKHILHIVKDYDAIPKEAFNIDLKEIELIKSFPLLSLFFYYRSDEIVKLPSDEFSKMPPIIKHFIYFRFSNLTDISHFSFPNKPDYLDPTLDPVTLCIWFFIDSDSRKLSTFDENIIINKILKLIFKDNNRLILTCYFTCSLFLYFSSKCKNKFSQDQINLLISGKKLCPDKLKFFMDILVNFKPS
jgi:hypothetical protein